MITQREKSQKYLQMEHVYKQELAILSFSSFPTFSATSTSEKIADFLMQSVYTNLVHFSLFSVSISDLLCKLWF